MKAQITEPNGEVVPGASSDPNETPLGTFFQTEGEAIDASTMASIEPGTFSPRCDFQATLVLSESMAAGGLAWYNVPDDPNAAPAAYYELIAPTTTTGTVINSGDIITSPNYSGGLIGFALTRLDSTGTATYAAYYSEYRRNALCSQCATPDHWKMMLVYSSTSIPNTFYLAFEDWPGADAQSWQGNDGDFNDKVFRVTGVTCLGGGEPCDTGKLGHCAAGLTECQPGGILACRQQLLESDEVCDNVDNNCDGQVDNGAPCPPALICRQGMCEPPCGAGEFRCSANQYCTTEGLCVDPNCADITCEAGQVCRAGSCVGACDGVSCPIGQTCQLGRCVDPCANVTCEGATVCDRGVCVEPCSCRPCNAELSCAASGACVEPGCETQVCDNGSVCDAGSCVDACSNAVCPGGADCVAGQCEEPVGAGAGGAPATTTTGGIGIGTGTGGTFTLPPTSGSTTAANTSPDATSNSTSGRGATGEAGGCGCRLTNTTSNLAWLGSGLLLVSLFGARRRFGFRSNRLVKQV